MEEELGSCIPSSYYFKYPYRIWEMKVVKKKKMEGNRQTFLKEKQDWLSNSLFKFALDITSHQSEWSSLKSLHLVNAREGVEKREPCYTIGGNVNWCSHYGEQYRSSFKY